MSGLDTRGFMDSALRAYDITDRHFQRKEDAEMRRADRDFRLAQAEKADQRYEKAFSLRQAADDRANKAHIAQYGEDGKGGWQAAEREQQGKLRDAQIAQANTAAANNQYMLLQQKKSTFISENSPVLDAGWQRFMKTGEYDEIFDSEFIKGSAYDPRRYLDPKVNQAADVLEAKIPLALKGEVDFNDPDMKEALTTFYKSNLTASVGQKDPKTGRVIKDARWGSMTFTKDIDPNREGDQPGIVIASEVQYEDGNDWVVRPVTEGRSTAPEDAVKVIPLEQAMQDITGQLKLRRQASLSPAYKSVFGTKDKESAAIDKEYRDAVLDIEKQRNEAIQHLGLGSKPEDHERTEQHYDNLLRKTKALFYGDGTVQPELSQPDLLKDWAGSDANKAGFLQALKARGQDLSQFDVATIDRAYIDQVNKKKAEKATTIAGQIRLDKAKQYASR